MHDAVCDKCGKDCKVPFKPSGERPIYCSDCFEKKGGSDSNRSRDRRDSPRRGFGGRDLKRPLLHDAVCDKCGKDCKVPFKPSGERPIYCSDCFEKKDKDSPRGNLGGRDSGRFLQSNISDRSILQLVEKINILNIKLDTIIDLLSLAGEKKPELVEVKTKKSEKSKTKKAKKATKAKKK
ncbi:hypothetical protein KJ608_01995 [Patescibacteria group bacterium]|nr:hypothetical protein [Patescibacteria group bacterium]